MQVKLGKTATVYGALKVGNGNGEMTGTIWIEESGIDGHRLVAIVVIRHRRHGDYH
jgi:hypothetical protein